MKKIRLATVWLDGCAGCHMSLLDMDEAILAVAQRAEVVYGPLVDAQEFPKAVDVTLIEGAVSSQDDLEKLRTIRQRTKLLVALGDCAVTGNVPAMRNSGPTAETARAHLYRRRPGDPRRPVGGSPGAAAPGRSGARSGESGSACARLPAGREIHRVGAGRIAGRPHAGPGLEGEIRIGTV